MNKRYAQRRVNGYLCGGGQNPQGFELNASITQVKVTEELCVLAEEHFSPSHNLQFVGRKPCEL